MPIESNLRNTTLAHLHQSSPENLGKHTATGVYSACGLLLPGRSKCRGPMALSTERGRRGAGFHVTNLYQAGNYEQATSPRSVGGTCHLPGFLCGNCGRDLDGDAYAGCKSFDGFKIQIEIRSDADSDGDFVTFLDSKGVSSSCCRLVNGFKTNAMTDGGR